MSEIMIIDHKYITLKHILSFVENIDKNTLTEKFKYWDQDNKYLAYIIPRAVLKKGWRKKGDRNPNCSDIAKFTRDIIRWKKKKLWTNKY